MSIANWLGFGKEIATPVEAIGNAVDKVFTSDEERLEAQNVLNKLAMQPSILQAELNKIESQHRSLLVASWRPMIGHICWISLLFIFIGNPVIGHITGNTINVPSDVIFELVLAMLGMGSLRTIEKMQGKTK
jgi:hypothetical protein